MNSANQDIIVFKIPVIIAKKNQISAHGMKNANFTIEHLLIDCEYFTVKEVMNGILYHVTLNHITVVVLVC